MIYSLKYTEQMPDANTGGYARLWFVSIRRSGHTLKRLRMRYWDDLLHRQQYLHPRYTQDQLRDMYAGWLAAPGWVEGYDLQDICTKEQALKLLAQGPVL